MELNLYILHDFLSIPTSASLHVAPAKHTLKRPAFLPAVSELLRPDRVYILHPAELQRFSDSLSGIHFIFIGSPTNAERSKWTLEQNEYLYTEQNILFSDLYNAVEDVFERFSEWESCLNQALLNSQDSLQALGNCSLDFMRNPFFLTTVSFFITHLFEKKKPKELCYFRKEDYQSFQQNSSVQELLSNQDFLLSWSTDGPQPFPAADSHLSEDGNNRFCLYQNITIGGKKLLRVVLREFDVPIRSSDYAVLDIFSSYVQKAVRHLQAINLTFHPAYFDSTVCDLAHGRHVEPQQLHNILTFCTWHPEDTLLCCVIAAAQDSKIGSLINACWRLEEQIAGSCAVPDGDQIIFLVNLSVFYKDKNELTIAIAYQLREFLMKAGYSYEFQGLENLYIYYAQASIALSYGQAKDDTLWSYHFEHYALSYMLEQCFQNIDPAIFCHHGLLQLLEYDRKKGRNYTATLRAYLENNMNIAQTIKKIYIQRASFQYQLKKILEITDANLQEYQTRLHLLLSFQLLDRREQVHTHSLDHNS